MSDPLKLMALDDEDLVVVSAHIQDSVLKSSDVTFDKASATLAITLRRFAWEVEARKSWIGKLFSREHERRLSVLHFARVSGVRSQGIEIGNSEQTLSLLSCRFSAKEEDSPEGTLHLIFAGEARLAVEVECIEAKLTDIGGAWQTNAKPDHTLDRSDA